MLVADTPEKVELFRLLALRGSVYLETKGMENSRGSVTQRVKNEFGFKGRKLKVLKQLEDHIEETYGELKRRYTERD
jgi:hypothetical protein